MDTREIHKQATKEAIYFIVCMILLIAFVLLMNGCRSYSEVAQKNYINGVIQTETVYKSDTGWHFWSEGVGKNITISPTVNGLQF